MRDSVESHGIWRYECEREGKKKWVERGRERGNLLEEGGEDGEREEW